MAAAGLAIGAIAAGLFFASRHLDVEPDRVEAEVPPVEPAKATPPVLPVLSTFDRLDRAAIPREKLAAAGLGDPAKAPAEIVAILGESLPEKKHGAVWLEISPDGRSVALADDVNRRFSLWDPVTGGMRILRNDRGFYSRFSHDGALLAIQWLASGNIQILDVASAKPIQTLSSGSWLVNRLFAFSADDRFLYYSGQGGPEVAHRPLAASVSRGRPEDRPTAPTFEDGQFSMHALALSRDGSRLAISGVREKKNFVRLYNPSTGKALLTISEGHRPAKSLVFTADGKRLLQQNDYHLDIRIHDSETGAALDRFRGHEQPNNNQGNSVFDLALSPDGKLVASCDTYGVVHLWNPDTLKDERVLHLTPPHSGGFYGGIRQVLWAPDGRHLLTRNADGTVYVVRLATPTPVPAGKSDKK